MKNLQDFAPFVIDAKTEANITGGTYKMRKRTFVRPEASSLIKRKIHVYEEGSLDGGLPIEYPLYIPTDPFTPPKLP
ncbi:MAG: hypothetical protein J0L94_08710 [Rhodothermia bacterium]|nr:hypothetical protein [Rhodothermia bacterium]